MGKSEKTGSNHGIKAKTVVILAACTLVAGMVFGGLGMLIYKELSVQSEIGRAHV